MKKLLCVIFLTLLLLVTFTSCCDPLSTELGDKDKIEKIEIVHIDRVVIPDYEVVDKDDFLKRDEFLKIIEDTHIADVTDVEAFVNDMKKVDWQISGHSIFVGEDIDAVKIYHKNGSVWWITCEGEAYFNVETEFYTYAGGTYSYDESQFADLIKKYS